MNVVKFNDIVMSIDVLEAAGLVEMKETPEHWIYHNGELIFYQHEQPHVIHGEGHHWTIEEDENHNDFREDPTSLLTYIAASNEWVWTDISPFTDITIEEFCTIFNKNYRNKYSYAIRWKYLVPMTFEDFMIGNPFDETIENSYISAERDLTPEEESDMPSYAIFENLKSWMDQVTTLNILQSEAIKYKYLNDFTPDDDIAIEELKVFRIWLASILYANTPMVESWKNPEMLKTMLMYYKMNMNDLTINNLSKFSGYMKDTVLVSGSGKSQVNLAALGLSSGCGCFGGMQGVSVIGNTVACDPIQMYRTSIYNYMIEVFSNIDYWTQQVEICVEMRKYINGILKAGLPLNSLVIDPLADCGCNTLDGDAQVRYTNMLKALIQALTYIIDSEVAGNKNYISVAFSNWATYLYENMYWA